MEYEQALAWVQGLPRLAAHPGVENEQKLLERLGHPEAELKFVHVAGTNGKGSTCVMLAAILREAGYKTGLTVSPYVLDFRERFQIDGEMIPRARLAAVLTRVRAAVEALAADGWDSVVAFDVVTAAALLWFWEERCDLVVLETGLGGRLDSTNAVQNTLLACITAIGKDHTELLGDTYAKIAREKCGIFKNRCPVVAYPQQHREAMDEITLCARRAGCPLCVPEREDFHFYQGAPFENRVNYGGYELSVPFPGAHQAYNAAVALEAALALCGQGFDISDEAIQAGIAAARFPARIEVLSKQPLVLVDGGHNPDGIRALADTLAAAGVKDLCAVIGILRDKGAGEMLHLLCPFVRAVYTVTPDSPRAMDAEELARLARPLFHGVTACAGVAEALELARQEAQDGLLVCGSLYLAAEARRLLTR